MKINFVACLQVCIVMDTIFAPISNLGGSVVSVRFSGKTAFDVLDFFGIAKDIYTKKNLFFARLKDKKSGKIVDEVVVKIFREPNSFTGENIVEFDLHSNRLLLNELLEKVATIPHFRFAKNGEFSRRAFLNGKIDLIKSEGINAIIRAETKQQQQLANEMFYGNIHKKYQEIRQKLIEAMSFVETQIDFSEEEVPQNVIENVKKITNELVAEFAVCLQDKTAIDKINNGISIAIIGEPNVGKSTLLNWLAKREIAIVSPIAGTTRDVLSMDVDLGGYKTTFYDTAGLRESEDIIEQEGVKRAKNIAQDSDLCLILFDKIEDYKLHKDEYCNKYKDVIFVVNKSDLFNKTADKRDNDVLFISLLNNTNLDILMQKITSKVLEKVELKHNPLVMNERHFLLIKECIDVLKNIDFDTMPIEIIGEELRIAVDRIGQITGQVYTDDILDNIFSKFCIGK